MKTVVITGVAGFIGSNLLAELLRRNFTVIGIDNLSQGFMRNIQVHLNNPNFQFVKDDVRNFEIMNKITENASCIVHLAAFKIPRYGHALDTLWINTKGTENILEAARNNGCKAVIASTSDVYGKNPHIPFKEDGDLVIGNPMVKRWSYAVSKMFDEQLCFAYRDKYGVPIVIMRYFGSYGPNQNLTWWGGPQSVFISAALNNKPLEIHGDGQQTRSFTYVSDTIDGTLRCIEDEKAIGEVFNIGNNKEITIIDLARLVWRLVCGQSEVKLNFVPYSNFGKYEDVRRRIPDISKAKKLLQFEPKVELEEGLIKTIEWQNTMMNKYNLKVA
ncbi:MAG: GDP-mannose 4,6-dehydratase [Candidatus Hodarchaeota archaeon]